MIEMTEIQKVKAEIKMLEKKLSFLEELEKTKSPVKEAFKRVYGYYPKDRENGVWTISWSAFQDGYIAAKEEDPEDTEWKSVALRFGEELVSIGPCGYYEFTAEEWFDWVVNTYEKLCDDTVKLLKKEKVKKSKINDLAEKLLPDDHPYKIADEHGETNPYKQYLNSVEDEKKMEELGFVKNSDGSWTARPLGETAQELVKKLQEKEWDVDVKTNLKPHWEPKPQNENEVAEGLREAFVKAQKSEKWKETQKLIDEGDNDKNFKNSLDLIKEWGDKNKPPTLKELLWEWWEDIFTVDSDLDADASIDVLVDIIDKKFIPHSHNTNDYQWNKCLKIMREKLR